MGLVVAAIMSYAIIFSFLVFLAIIFLMSQQKKDFTPDEIKKEIERLK